MKRITIRSAITIISLLLIVISLLNFKYNFLGHLFQQSVSKGKISDPLHFVSDTIDLGSIREGTQSNFQFPFENSSSDSIKIIDAQAGCDCTEVYFPKNLIKKGEHGTIRIKYNSYGKNGEVVEAIRLTLSGSVKSQGFSFKINVFPFDNNGKE